MTEPRPLNNRMPAAAMLPEIPEGITDPVTREYLFDLKRQLSKLFDSSRTVVTDGQSPPVLHVARAAAQSLTAATPTRVQFDTTRYDTHGYWDAANFRYLPKVAGYYRVSWSVKFDAEASGCNVVTAALYVNGVADKSVDIVNPTTTAGVVAANSTTVYCDGSTRYLEVWAACTAATSITADKAYTFLSVELIGDNYPGVLAGTDAATGLGAGGTGSCTIAGGVDFGGAIWVTAIGAGAGGVASTVAANGGGGGGAGELVSVELYYATPGASYSYAIGAGGASGANGGDTTFAALTAGGGRVGTAMTGGAGGGPRTSTGGAGANPGGTGGFGQPETATYFSGSAGGGGGSTTAANGGPGGGSGGRLTGGAGGVAGGTQAGGGGGAASVYGVGGAGGAGGVVGVAAASTSYGAGGGGGGGHASGQAGGAGAGGYLLVAWIGGAVEFTSGSGTWTSPT
jgi:hypothetical protein